MSVPQRHLFPSLNAETPLSAGILNNRRFSVHVLRIPVTYLFGGNGYFDSRTRMRTAGTGGGLHAVSRTPDLGCSFVYSSGGWK
jgi:hypothetical protein